MKQPHRAARVLTHRAAVGTMVVVTLLWSIAGVVTRQLESAQGFEVTFWRSAFNALALGLYFGLVRDGQGARAGLLAALARGRAVLWLSGLAWGVMFTAFMLALTLTTVANVLVTLAIEPLVSTFLARFALGQRVPARTVWAALVAGLGIAWMYGSELARSEGRHLVGTLVGLLVPLAAAANWTLVQHAAHGPRGSNQDMRAAVLIGTLLSAAAMLVPSLPFQASAHDLALLALLGVVQLALPCLLAVAAAKVLSAPEVSLIALLEVVFGVAWAWLGAGEQPSAAVLAGGALVLGAMVANEALATRDRRA